MKFCEKRHLLSLSNALPLQHISAAAICWQKGPDRRRTRLFHQATRFVSEAAVSRPQVCSVGELINKSLVAERLSYTLARAKSPASREDSRITGWEVLS